MSIVRLDDVRKRRNQLKAVEGLRRIVQLKPNTFGGIIAAVLVCRIEEDLKR